MMLGKTRADHGVNEREARWGASQDDSHQGVRGRPGSSASSSASRGEASDTHPLHPRRSRSPSVNAAADNLPPSGRPRLALSALSSLELLPPLAFSETIAKSISPSDRARLAQTSRTMHEALAADLQRDKIIASSFDVNALDGFREILASARMLDEFRRGEVLTAICPALTRLPEPEFQPAFNEFLQIAQALTRCPELLAEWMEALAEGDELPVDDIAEDGVRNGELPESAAFTYGIGTSELDGLQLAAKDAALPEIRSRGHIRDVCRRRGISDPSIIRDLMLSMIEVAQAAVSSGKNVKAVARQLDMDAEFVPLLEEASIGPGAPSRMD